ncbi:MAG: RlmE family RNA methyltransferase [Rhizomicrobium sp.]
MRGSDFGSDRSSGRVRVQTARRRSVASTRWLERQLNDPYVVAAKTKGYRSRAAFKLKELDSRFRLIKPGMRVLDLGAAPGGWSQVAAELIGDKGKIVAADILPMEPIAGVEIFQCDLLDPDTPDMLKTAMGGPADLVMTDMASPTTGHRQTDHIRTLALFEAALDLAEEVLVPGGAFIGKVFQGGTANELLIRVKKRFSDVKHAKPPASRAESVELYLVALGFRPEKTEK